MIFGGDFSQRGAQFSEDFICSRRRTTSRAIFRRFK
jgi:hypothetical protein